MKKNVFVYESAAYDVEDYLDKLEIPEEKSDLSPWEITYSEGMPVIGVPGKHCGQDSIGYLTPFRAYRFQVSGTLNGSGDFGASPVMTDMYKLAQMDELGYKCLRSLALDAIRQYGGNVGYNEVTQFDAFICLCADYLREHADHIKRCYGIA